LCKIFVHFFFAAFFVSFFPPTGSAALLAAAASALAFYNFFNASKLALIFYFKFLFN
jgi:hypothetical protein